MKKLALVLSGGGFKGAFQLGALEYLYHNWDQCITNITGDPDHNIPPMHFDIISGVSVGSLNGFFLATGSFDKLAELWKEVEQQGPGIIYTSDFIDSAHTPQGKIKFNFNLEIIRNRFPHTFKNLLFHAVFNRKKIPRKLKKDLMNFESLADNTPLKEKLLSFTDPNNPTALADKIRQNNCIYRCGFVSLDTGVYKAPLYSDFKNDTELCKAILASTAMPVVWAPVPSIETHTETFTNSVDGGIVNVSPLGDVIKEINQQDNNDEYAIIVINCSNGQIEKEHKDRNIAQIAVRSLADIAITEIFNNDLKEFLNINSILCQLNMDEIVYKHYNWHSGSETQKRRKRFKALVIQPDTTLGDTLLASPQSIRERRNAGSDKAAKVLGDIRKQNIIAKG